MQKLGIFSEDASVFCTLKMFILIIFRIFTRNIEMTSRSRRYQHMLSNM